MSVFLVLALVSQLVLWCVIAWSRVRLSVGYWLFLLCAGLPSFVIKNQCLPIYSIIIIIIIPYKFLLDPLLSAEPDLNPATNGA